MGTPRLDGIDISHWNVITDFSAVPDFALVSLKATEGRFGVSRVFAERRRLFEDRGTKYLGFYHWIRSDSTVQAQAEHFIRTVGDLPAGQFVQNDWETTTGIPNVPWKWIDEWNDRIRQHYGRDCVITYSSDWVPGFAQWREAHPDEPLWYANYSTHSRATGGWAEVQRWRADIWQYSSTAKVPGFATGIDANMVFNWETLDRLTALGPGTPPEVVVPPKELPDMFTFSPKGYSNVFLLGAGPATPLSPEAFQLTQSKGIPHLDQIDHEWMLEAALHQSGLTRRALAPRQ